MKKKIKLTGTTILMPFRLETHDRMENLKIILDYIKENFDVRVVLLEADIEQRFYSCPELQSFSYTYVYDDKPYFYHTHYRNKLTQEVQTRVIIFWDVDCLCNADQLLSAINAVRKNHFQMALPYNGQVHIVHDIYKSLLKPVFNMEVLNKNKEKMPVLYGHFSTGGIVVLDREAFIKTGMENEKILGWGPEDLERMKRMEISGFSVYRGDAPLFHLDHPRYKTSMYFDKATKRNSLYALIETCKRKS